MTVNKDDLLFVPLGGAEEIGMNANLYHYKNKWIMIDLGSGFVNLPGIDMIVPEISFISKHADKLLAIILTHIHEDHCGAIRYLWQELRCPIYATKFAIAFLKAKLAKCDYNIPFHEIKAGETLILSPFQLEFISLTHSTPEMNAIAIHTEQGTIFHTGDWKLDKEPVVGADYNENRLREIGNTTPPLALVCDSTNALSAGWSQSEGMLYDGLFNLITRAKQLVTVTLFASNIARIKTLLHIAQTCNRKVVLLGRALHNIFYAAEQSNYLTREDFISVQQARELKPHELLLLCTGCQGEELAAARKLTFSTHQDFRLSKGDMFIFSSKIIPGNEKKIAVLLNKLTLHGIEVITEKDHDIHASGHPSRDELQQMYTYLKPKFAIPVHGEYVHTHAHAKIAKDCGATPLVVSNGDVIKITEQKIEKIMRVKAGSLCIDGTVLRDADCAVMQMRKQICNSGIVIVIITINHKNTVLKKPSILTPGALSIAEDKAVLDEIHSVIVRKLQANTCKIPLINRFIETLAKTIQRIIKRMLDKTTQVIVQVEKV